MGRATSVTGPLPQDGPQAAPRPIATSISAPDLRASSSTSSSTEAPLPSALKPWSRFRPRTPGAAPQLTRRQLRALNRPFTAAELRQHVYRDDCWIAVNGDVYDITDHVLQHPGWRDAGQATTVLSIMAHAGTECSEEFTSIHRYIPEAWRQLRPYYIGALASAQAAAAPSP
jgi:nitrate reductase (NAD(P)H)